MSAESNVDNLLATIRKAIDKDIDALDRADPPKAKSAVTGSMRQFRVSVPVETTPQPEDLNIMQLRERVSRNKLESSMSMPNPVVQPRPVINPSARTSGMSRILAGTPVQPRNEPALLRPSYAAEIEHPPQQHYEEPHYADPHYAEPQYSEPPSQLYYQPAPPPSPEPVGGALMSPDAAYAAQNSFQMLSDALMAQLGGQEHMSEVASDILRPMLQRWLDENLPPLVERLVREEIERVARRGR